jgi:tetratricopeptide (TPR) repeat protein
MQYKFDQVSSILNELDKQKSIPLSIQLLDKVIEQVIEICEEFYKNNEHLSILRFYKLISPRYKKIIKLIKNSNDTTDILSSIQKSYEYWKKKEERIKKLVIETIIIEGDLLLSEGKYEEALSKFHSVINHENHNIEILKKCGITYFHLQQYEKALEYFNRVLQLDEKDIRTFYNIGLAYELLHDNHNDSDINSNLKKYLGNAALLYYKMALTANPNHFESLVALGIFLYKVGNYYQSKKQLELAIKIRNNDWRLLLAIGCVLSDGYNQYKEAKEYFEQSLTFNPNSNVAKMNLAQVLILLNDFDKSQKYLEEILVKLTDIEDRSTAIILRTLLICSIYLNKNEMSQKYTDELLEYSELKNFQLIKWNFNNLIDFIRKSEINKKTKKLLISILSISKIDESSKSKFLNDIRRLTKSIQLNIVDKISIISKSEPDKSDVGWYYWETYIKGLDDNDDIISSIDSIDYILDPTYKDTKKTIRSQDNGFLIRGKGWSSFDLIMIIYFKNGKKVKKYHKITFTPSHNTII